MNSPHHLTKQYRPPTSDEQSGMANLLSALKKLRQLATGKQSVDLGESGGDVIIIQPIPECQENI